MRGGRKKPLWRKVNTRTHHVRHAFAAGDARHERNRKDPEWEFVTKGSMHRKHRHGRDYTPLYRFLLSRVGASWEEVEPEAASRLDEPAMIETMVTSTPATSPAMFRAGKSTYDSTLFVDGDGTLRRVDPDLRAEILAPYCPCCTQALSGERSGLPYNPKDRPTFLPTPKT